MEEGGGAGLTPHEIYKALTEGPGAASLDNAQQATAAEAQLLGERAERINRIAGKIQAGWQGAAADGAHGAAGPLADMARADADHLERAQRLLEEEGGWFRTVSNRVRPVAPAPPQSDFFNDMTPWDTDLDREIRQWQEDAEHNIAVYSAYDSDTWGNQQQLPREFPAIADQGGDIAVRSQGGQPGGPPPDGPRLSWEPKLPGGEDPNRSSGPHGGDGPVGGPPPNGERQQNSEPPPQQATDPAEFVPPPGSPPGPHPPIGGPPPPPGPPPGQGPGPIVPPPVGLRGPGADGGRGGPGFRGGVSDGGPGGRGPGGPGARGAGGEHGVGGRPGAGAFTAEEAAARRGGVGAAGARGGAAGMGGAGPMGAGRGQGGEDYDHERKYTIEPDPEALFGTDQLTAPPVIGVDEE